MAGDPFHAAWIARVQQHIESLGIAWPMRDLDAALKGPDASRGFIWMDFPGGQPETLGSWGSPGDNIWDEYGQVSIDVYSPLSSIAARDEADRYASLLRTICRSDRFTFNRGDGVLLKIRVTGTAPLTDGLARGGLRVVSAMLAYHLQNRG